MPSSPCPSAEASRHPAPVAARAPVDATVLVAHSCALVAAGLAAAIGGRPHTAVVGVDASKPLVGVPWSDIRTVVADLPGLARARAAVAWERARLPAVLWVKRDDEDFASVGSLWPVPVRAVALDCDPRDLLKELDAALRGEPTNGGPLAAPAKGGLAPGTLRRVFEILHAHPGQGVALQTLATVAQLSPRHFSRAFKQSIGMSPKRFMLERRVAEAVRLVTSTDLPLCIVANQTGFADASEFTRVFVRLAGETPRACRRRHR